MDFEVGGHVLGGEETATELASQLSGLELVGEAVPFAAGVQTGTKEAVFPGLAVPAASSISTSSSKVLATGSSRTPVAIVVAAHSWRS